MEVKESKPISFLFFRVETKISELSQYLMIGQDLFREAVMQKLMITGPVHWHYFGFQGDESKPFVLEISLPVAQVPKEYDGTFHFKRTESFKCLSMVHDGSWLDLPKSYGKMMTYVTENNLRLNATNREIYINADFEHPEACVTEIQMGIQ